VSDEVRHLTVEAWGQGPNVKTPAGSAVDLCILLTEWAKAADVSSPRCGSGYLAIRKSDLLARLIYGKERGPSQTPCPVHQGSWSGCHSGWPGSVWVNAEGETPMDIEPRLQEWWDAGCRCATHRGSSCTTGWNPDEHCCGELLPGGA